MICLVNKKELQMTQFTYLQLFHEEKDCLELHQVHCQIHHQIHRQIDLNGLLIISISIVRIVHKKELQFTSDFCPERNERIAPKPQFESSQLFGAL